jgi:endoribonuclease Dicer
MFLVFPPIIHRIEDYMIALEAAKVVGIDIGPALALEAMTKDSDNSEDHATDDRINFRPGMGNNYERLEFMGDCFLKTATSISLFVLKPHDDEFECHVARMHMISNQNLMNHALELQLTDFVRSLAFSR